jgi:hypothetical protein
VDLAISRWQGDGSDVLYVSDARTDREVGRYDRKTGRLTVGDHARVYEVVQALWAFLSGVAGEQQQPAAVSVDEPRPAAAPDIDGHLLGLRIAAPVRESGPRAGAKAVRVVDRRLGLLRRDGWAVLDSVGKLTGADIDRLVIGPPGVFAITLQQGDDVQRYLHDSIYESRREAAFAARMLSAASGLAVRVTPILAFVGAAGDAIDMADLHEEPEDVLVARAEEIVEVLRDLPSVYSIDERYRILDAARGAASWGPIAA